MLCVTGVSVKMGLLLLELPRSTYHILQFLSDGHDLISYLYSLCISFCAEDFIDILNECTD